LIVQKTFLYIFYIITAPLSPVWLEHPDFGEAPPSEIWNVLWLVCCPCVLWLAALRHVWEMSCPFITASSFLQ